MMFRNFLVKCVRHFNGIKIPRKRLKICLFIIATILLYIFIANYKLPKVLHRIFHLNYQVEVYPFMAFIYTFENTVTFCGGTLINRRFILTAAHCLYETTSVGIVLGTTDISSSTQLSKLHLKSDEFIIHENYTHDAFDDDIALIKLDEDVETNDFIDIIHPASSTKINITHDSFQVVGWGLKGYEINDDVSAKDISVVENKKCISFYQSDEPLFDSSRIICSMNARGPCYGDSGGPLLMDNIQIGVVLIKDESCGADTPIVYLNVGYYNNWISRKIEETLKK